MRQFDVMRARQGLAVIAESDLIENERQVVIIPLFPVSSGYRPARHLNPIFEIDGEPHVLATRMITSASRAGLQGRKITNLYEERDILFRALDMLLRGW